MALTNICHDLREVGLPLLIWTLRLIGLIKVNHPYNMHISGSRTKGHVPSFQTVDLRAGQSFNLSARKSVTFITGKSEPRVFPWPPKFEWKMCPFQFFLEGERSPHPPLLIGLTIETL